MPTTVQDMLADARKRVAVITPKQAAKMIARGGVLVVDARDPIEVQQSGKVTGAIDMSRGLIESRADPEGPMHLPDFQKDKPAIPYCASGGRSTFAGRTFQALGCVEVDTPGVYQTWTEAGLPIEKARRHR